MVLLLSSLTDTKKLQYRDCLDQFVRNLCLISIFQIMMMSEPVASNTILNIHIFTPFILSNCLSNALLP